MPTTSNWMTPLARAERFLTNRLLDLERILPDNQPDAPLWSEYVHTVHALTRVLDRLRPHTVAGLMSEDEAKTRMRRSPPKG